MTPNEQLNENLVSEHEYYYGQGAPEPNIEPDMQPINDAATPPEEVIDTPGITNVQPRQEPAPEEVIDTPGIANVQPRQEPAPEQVVDEPRSAAKAIVKPPHLQSELFTTPVESGELQQAPQETQVQVEATPEQEVVQQQPVVNEAQPHNEPAYNEANTPPPMNEASGAPPLDDSYLASYENDPFLQQYTSSDNEQINDPYYENSPMQGATAMADRVKVTQAPSTNFEDALKNKDEGMSYLVAYVNSTRKSPEYLFYAHNELFGEVPNLNTQHEIDKYSNSDYVPDGKTIPDFFRKKLLARDRLSYANKDIERYSKAIDAHVQDPEINAAVKDSLSKRLVEYSETQKASLPKSAHYTQRNHIVAANTLRSALGDDNATIRKVINEVTNPKGGADYSNQKHPFVKVAGKDNPLAAFHALPFEDKEFKENLLKEFKSLDYTSQAIAAQEAKNAKSNDEILDSMQRAISTVDDKLAKNFVENVKNPPAADAKATKTDKAENKAENKKEAGKPEAAKNKSPSTESKTDAKDSPKEEGDAPKAEGDAPKAEGDAPKAEGDGEKKPSSENTAKTAAQNYKSKGSSAKTKEQEELEEKVAALTALVESQIANNGKKNNPNAGANYGAGPGGAGIGGVGAQFSGAGGSMAFETAKSNFGALFGGLAKAVVSTAGLAASAGAWATGKYVQASLGATNFVGSRTFGAARTAPTAALDNAGQQAGAGAGYVEIPRARMRNLNTTADMSQMTFSPFDPVTANQFSPSLVHAQPAVPAAATPVNMQQQTFTPAAAGNNPYSPSLVQNPAGNNRQTAVPKARQPNVSADSGLYKNTQQASKKPAGKYGGSVKADPSKYTVSPPETKKIENKAKFKKLSEMTFSPVEPPEPIAEKPAKKRVSYFDSLPDDHPSHKLSETTKRHIEKNHKLRQEILSDSKKLESGVGNKADIEEGLVKKVKRFAGNEMTLAQNIKNNGAGTLEQANALDSVKGDMASWNKDVTNVADKHDLKSVNKKTGKKTKLSDVLNGSGDKLQQAFKSIAEILSKLVEKVRPSRNKPSP